MRILRSVVLIIGLAVGPFAWGEFPEQAPDSLGAWVYKVEAERANGDLEIGSAIPVAVGRLVTNCHVVRNTSRIRVLKDDRVWVAASRVGDPYRDLCFLEVDGFREKVPPMTLDIAVGRPVWAVGYSRGHLEVTNGLVQGLHSCECDGGKVIQTTAAFDHGSSGGGLFDSRGRLVGILTFKAQAGGRYHFALPVGWLRGIAARKLTSISNPNAFWEQSPKESAYFLTACAMGARKDWSDLADLTREWVVVEPDNPEAWVAAGRAALGLGQPERAVPAFQHALLLDSTHAEALWELQKLELDLGRNLTNVPTGPGS